MSCSLISIISCIKENFVVLKQKCLAILESDLLPNLCPSYMKLVPKFNLRTNILQPFDFLFLLLL